jgi:glycosyltransferase involved in cell wall biosynthesis
MSPNLDPKAPLSVVIITKNESTRIRECIQSVLWADDIVVVDDESTDDTAAIARELGARVEVRRMDNEGRHRNAAYAMAKNEWVFSLDADERVTPELEAEIRQILIAGTPCNGFGVPRKNYVGKYWARWGGMYPSRQLKFFRRDAFKYEEEAEVHPRAIMHDPRGELKSDLIHYTYRDFSDIIAKLDRQTDLEARKWFRENRKVGLPITMYKMVDRFWKSYVTKKGHKDGVVGLFLSVNSGMYQFLTYLKVREMRLGTARVPN